MTYTGSSVSMEDDNRLLCGNCRRSLEDCRCDEDLSEPDEDDEIGEVEEEL